MSPRNLSTLIELENIKAEDSFLTCLTSAKGICCWEKERGEERRRGRRCKGRGRKRRKEKRERGEGRREREKRKEKREKRKEKREKRSFEGKM